ncbi:Asp-tRNA(Asn)/Glu-tRNA(Gln) amidotransferase subunit GatA [Ammonifex thiophilus]|uniref:Glutamyl-tRNA(Gln) amidotransferase subunit A n=1 Tax=Ammonifex thiophilus TaxID=444093 RepID=A0A3D8P4I7_9THEO|nr:Asp-tRNA(Asn)/Glu-tRNA(Gln) amidotransferase subunit GatA [Ammonifex thiophilus]RDV84023.1 Asp-tRNA(Asn)/Glu-tRNA(Gln) amidotransferase subunit GatA [Ammonifex thiophilus]
MEDICFLPAHVLRERFCRREISAKEIVTVFLERIKQVEPKVRAFLTLCEEEALSQAERLDQALARGEEMGPLAGVPVALKDNLCLSGFPTTCASKILANFYPPYDATVVRRLREAGAIIVGKTNLDEFAMGSSTENSAFHPTTNPWDLSRVPGGSSGGSAAAVAAGEVPVALGSDTGGSIRQPAAFCGVVGLKPTYGRVSRYGLVAFASSLDQIGPITRCVEDCALVLQVIAGHDPRDATSIPGEIPDYRSSLASDLKGMRIGIPSEYLGEGVAPEIGAVVGEVAAKLTDLGAQVDYTSLPHTRYALPAYYLVATAEASSNLARYDGVRYGLRVPAEEAKDSMALTRKEGFGPEVKRRIMLGTYALSAGYYEAYYLKALKVRTLIKRDFDKAFAHFDCLLTPTTPTPAFRMGEKLADPLAMYFSDICTLAVNLAGLPAISVPAGKVGHLPVGVQFIAPPLREDKLFQVAYALEQVVGFPSWRPPLEVIA